MSYQPPSSVPVEIPDGFKPLGTSGSRLLEIERSKASFSPADLEKYIYGDAAIERRNRILPVVENEVRSLPQTRSLDARAPVR